MSPYPLDWGHIVVVHPLMQTFTRKEGSDAPTDALFLLWSLTG